uniref:Hydroxysteroid dehydrogenase-like protein 2 n=1 Tax=Rhodosorus marinus TaxID=101924 RepID=A0A7S3EIR7_9RHOD|mmetsp:Transcript_39198/g.155487  ORF Transcript_39198/g.155487 Transcript_39198/m.155487 type:complete len:300 (+) Transcript_39198:89-988(+)
MAMGTMAPRTLAGRVAVVTGSTRGIGREIALKLASEGADIVVTGKSTEAQENLAGTIYSVAEEVRALGVRALPVRVDVRDDVAIENMVDATLKEFGRIDYLINNSGALWWRDVQDTPMSRYDLVHSINSRASFSCSHAVLPTMLKQGFGHIIVMSPPIDLNLLKGKVAYCISKYGMTMLAHGMGQELLGKGVAVNALWPATLIESFATKNFRMSESSQWRKASILADAVFSIIQEDPNTFTAQALIDEEYFASKGIHDLSKYRFNPDVEPDKTWPPESGGWDFQPVPGGKVPPGLKSNL